MEATWFWGHLEAVEETKSNAIAATEIVFAKSTESYGTYYKLLFGVWIFSQTVAISKDKNPTEFNEPLPMSCSGSKRHERLV